LSLLSIPVLAITMGACASGQVAKEGTAIEEAIARWIKELGDDSFKVRESATKNLVEAGFPAWAPLQLALEAPSDEEVRQRIMVALSKIKRKSVNEIARYLLRELDRNGLEGTIQRMANHDNVDTKTDWKLLEQMVEILLERAAQADEKAGPKLDWVDLPVSRACGPNNSSGKRFLMAGLYRNPTSIENAVVICDGPMEWVTSVENSVLLVRGKIKGFTSMHKCLVVCMGDFGEATGIHDSVILVTGNFKGPPWQRRNNVIQSTKGGLLELAGLVK
jgi:hypothetical protein